jgi:hypothetical protein
VAARSPVASPRSARPTARKRTRCTGPDCRKLAPAGRKRCDDHKPGRRPATAKIVYGCTEPRIWTRPLRPLTRETTHGYAVADFARMVGEPLLPWEEFVAIHALELLPDGHYRFRTVLVMAARQNGKSHLKRMITLWRMYVGGAREVLGTAQDVTRARAQWNLAQDTIAASPDLREEYEPPETGKRRNVNGDEWFRLAGGARYIISASNGKAARGGSYDEANIDELREQHDGKAWAAISKTTMARADGQLWAMSNAGEDESVTLNQLQAAGRAGTEETLGIFEYSAPDGCELDDIEAIRQANPGLGYLPLTLRSILSNIATDPPGIYRTEVLCQRVDALEGAIDGAAWKACADPSGTMDGLRKRLAASFDISIDGKHCTLAAAALLEDGKVRVEVVKSWDSTEQARAELPGLLDKVKPVKLGWFPSGPAAAFAPLLQARRNSEELPAGKASQACQGLADLVRGRQVVHGAQPLLDAHISGSRKLQAGDGWRFTRRGGGHCDGAYAAAGAVYLALTMPAPKRSRIRVLVA